MCLKWGLAIIFVTWSRLFGFGSWVNKNFRAVSFVAGWKSSFAFEILSMFYSQTSHRCLGPQTANNNIQANHFRSPPPTTPTHFLRYAQSRFRCANKISPSQRQMNPTKANAEYVSSQENPLFDWLRPPCCRFESNLIFHFPRGLCAISSLLTQFCVASS